jgi:hypothetical protein
MTSLEVGNRVRIDLDYPGGWSSQDRKLLRDRCGTVVQVDSNRILVQFDKRARQGQQILVTFHNPECLLLVKEVE